ncbi:Inosine triphosphate pyrophosphatase [Porphyridium purpureum]|uniref:Inosine triphosphate pyrophosphatase n=1 Tax=Porphyridium purpureum TaxID=35688 RepID=A0A5J4YIB4_PORPP|nr:Inosine triphosphate pyrophosphatase [Porphyridium purpureum]|eukprot:POR6714..scf261_15
MAASGADLTVTFVTGNENKLREVRSILGGDQAATNRVQLTSHKLDLPELQGDPLEIASNKARLAAQQLKCAVLVEDTSLCFNALQGLPGPYIKWFLEKIGHDGLNRMLDGFDDRSAYAQCIFAYCDGSTWSGEELEARTFVGKTSGTIVASRGPANFGWDPIFLPDGFHLTYAEMDRDVKNSISHRYRALSAVREFFDQAFPIE